MASRPLRKPKPATRFPRATRKQTGPLPRAKSARDALEMLTLQQFRTIVGSARRHDADIRRIAGIPGAQLWALSEIARDEGISVNSLAERMALHQTTASNLINALVERKLICRAKDAVDQRIVRLHATPDGKRMLVRAPGPYSGLLPDALSHLDGRQLAVLSQGLAILVAVLKRPVGDAAGEPLLGL